MKSIALFLIATLSVLLLADCGDSESATENDQIADNSDKMELWNRLTGPHLRGAVVHPCTDSQYNDGGVSCIRELSRGDLEELKALGANHVNASYSGLFLTEAPYAIDSTSLHYLDNLVGWAEEVGLYVVISFRSGPGRNEAAIHANADADYDIWINDDARIYWAKMWRYTAERYRSSDAVVGYDLMVEPHPVYAGADADDWNDLAAAVTDSIRTVDQLTPIIIESIEWSNVQTLSSLETTGDSRTVYSFHGYNPDCYTHQDEEGEFAYPDQFECDGQLLDLDSTLVEEDLGYGSSFGDEHAVPLYVSEFGSIRWVPDALSYHRDLLDIFEREGWNYAVYVWRGDDTEDGETFDGFNLEYGTDPDNHTLLPGNALLSLYTTFWSRNSLAP